MKLLFTALLACASVAGQSRPEPAAWRQVFEGRLPYLGQRNWIVIADSAYPLQSNPGVETILSNESQIETVRHVLMTLAKANHVRPIVYIDRELNFVAEQDAVGIGAYRQLLTGIFESRLPGMKIQTILHEQIVQQVDQAAKTYNILIIKTNSTLPYTSVFLELLSSYWNGEAQQRLDQIVH